jgi:hypothetical protein
MIETSPSGGSVSQSRNSGRDPGEGGRVEPGPAHAGHALVRGPPPKDFSGGFQQTLIPAPTMNRMKRWPVLSETPGPHLASLGAEIAAGAPVRAADRCEAVSVR